jgi:hypothetical protein
MALRNSVKATLLSELEQPRSRSDEPRPIVEEPAPAPSVAKRPLESTAQRPLESTAQRPSETTAQQIAPPAKSEACLAAAWHARAEELYATADTLPCKTSWSLLSKIASLYDELARDTGWTGPEAPAPDEVRLEAPQAEEELPAAEEPQALAPPADPPPAERVALPRRPLPLGRRFPRRRA